MKTKISLIIFFVGMCTLNAYADTSRDLLIQKELDCMDQHKNDSLTWSDVCSMPGPSTTQAQDSQVVNQQLGQPSGIVPPPPTAFNDRMNTFSIAPQAFYNHYSEPHGTRTVTGVWEGIEGNYTFRPPQDNIMNTPVFNYYAIDGLYATGKNDVDQNIESTNNLSYYDKLKIKDIPGDMFDGRILLGRDFIPLPSLRVTPYTGFGVRYKTDQAAGHFNTIDDGYIGGTSVLGYDRSTLYYYIPTGLTFDLAANNDYEISWNLEYDYLVKGYERDDYSGFDWYSLPNYGFTNQNLRYTLDHGWGGRSSLKFLKHLSSVDVYLEPYIRYWDISASKAASGNVGGGNFTNTANKNATVEIGSSLGVQF